MNALVIGYGSIGARHAQILTEIGCRTVVVSRHQVDFPVAFYDLAAALESESPEYLVIANETDQHQSTLAALVELGYKGTVMIEKPLFHRYVELPQLPFKGTYVAYNLRFHPIIRRLKSLLEKEQILSVQAYVGQYLPDWRPASDYRLSYSANAARGGGVIRDLSHELDYLCWLLGRWKKVVSIGGHVSTLEITSDDIFALMLTTSLCSIVSLQLNYLDRTGRRFIIVNTEKHTIEADLIHGTIKVDFDNESFPVERDQTYREMHEAILSGNTDMICSLDEGLETLKLIESSELANKNRTWIEC